MHVKFAETEAEMLAVRELRIAVFVEEQGCPLDEEFDEFDKTGHHAIAVNKGAVVGTGRVYLTTSTEAHIGRMAVALRWRRAGTGSLLLAALETRAAQIGATAISLHAQTQAQRFYSNAGYQPQGDTFMEVDIEHILMTKSI